MKIYNIGANPIAYTGNPQKLVKTAARQLAPATDKSDEILAEIAANLDFYPKGKDDALLNFLYKYLPNGCERKLENFNGERKISVRKDPGCLTKITRRLTEPRVTFKRMMINKGTNENPRLITTNLWLRKDWGFEDVELKWLGPRKILLEVWDEFSAETEIPHTAIYETWHDIYTQDKIFQYAMTKMTGRDFTKYYIPPKKVEG